MTSLSVVGLLESSLYVADLNRSIGFYADLFGFPVIHSEGDRMCGLNVSDRQVLLLFRIGGSRQPTDTSNGRIPSHDGNGTQHVAFAISPDQIDAWRARLREKNITIESEVNCGGLSIYFRDPDGHLLELITPGCWPIY